MPLAQLKTQSTWLTRTARYSLRLAAEAEDIVAAQRLRFNVFNLELGEGLAESFQYGRDADPFDEQCDHLLLTENVSGLLVGTYRLQTYGMAQAGQGFYAATEFDLSYLPKAIQSQSIELGRACIAPEQRHSEALLLMWRGIANYAQQAGKRYLFGCCSLRSQEPRAGWSLTQELGQAGHLHSRLFVPPRAGWECDDAALVNTDNHEAVALPQLLQSYLRFGAKVCGPPALDKQFGTIDFFTLFDFNQLNERARRLLGS